MKKPLAQSNEVVRPLHHDAERAIARILVVVDPTADEHPCADKAGRIAAATGASLELFICDADQGGAAERAAREERHLVTLDGIADRLRSRGLRVTTRAGWHAPLEQGIAAHAIRTAPDLVVKDTHRHASLAGRAASGHTDWTLIRQVPAPLMLVRSSDWPQHPRVTVGLDPCHPAERPTSLEVDLLEFGVEITKAMGGSLDAIHVQQSPPHLPGERISAVDRQAARENAQRLVEDLVARHNERGEPIPIRYVKGPVPSALVGYANVHDSDLFVIGVAARPRSAQPGSSGTAAQILESLPCDLLVLKPAGFVSPLLITED